MSASVLENQTREATRPEGRFSRFRNWVRQSPPWAFSFVVHAVLIVALASITRYTILHNPVEAITSLIEPPPEDVEFVIDSKIVDQLGNQGQMNSAGPTQMVALVTGQDPQQQMEERIADDLLNVELPPTADLAEPQKAELISAIAITGTTEHPGGIDGSIDIITSEILGSLRERETLVIWLFDASLSLKERRNRIADRFENIYRQLGLVSQKEAKLSPLKTAVVSFGARTNYLTPQPIADIDRIVKAVREIPPDDSGVENIFGAVSEVAERWKGFRQLKHNIMIVAVTDERGDDYQNVEAVIGRLSRMSIRTYCIGNIATFGREQGYTRWVYEDGSSEMLPVDQGPETYALERLNLGFWEQWAGSENLSAGFGPYALTRLCRETSGMYLVADEGNGRQFDPAIMKQYEPDYRPIVEYRAELEKNRAKSSLVNAAMGTRAVAVPAPERYFPAPNLNVLRQSIQEAQKPFAAIDLQLRQMLEQLERGEKDRAAVAEPRWRASYDLAMGRLLALRVRAFGYNSVLAAMKTSPLSFTEEGNDAWELRPADTPLEGAQLRKLYDRAREYLQRVVDEHPGTPWAAVAQFELSQPVGWKWQDYNSLVARFGPAARDPAVAARLLEEAERQMQDQPQMPERPRPKL